MKIKPIYRAIIVVLFMLLIIAWNAHTRINEKFSNSDILEYNADIQYENNGIFHHPMNPSLPINLHVKYNNAYYYEYDNAKYLEGLKKQLNITPESHQAQAIRKKTWNPPQTLTQSTAQNILDAYASCLQTFLTILNNGIGTSSNALTLPGSNPLTTQNIQIVHDILIHYEIPIANDTNMYLFDIEMLLYRESKFQGKHIGVRCLFNSQTKELDVTSIGIIGEVSEDQIGLFPVNPSNPFEIDQLSTSFSVYPTILTN